MTNHSLASYRLKQRLRAAQRLARRALWCRGAARATLLACAAGLACWLLSTQLPWGGPLVLLARHPIQAGASLEPSDFRTVRLPLGAAPESRLSTVPDDAKAATKILPGEPLTSARLIERRIPPGQVALPLLARTAGLILQPGDRIALYGATRDSSVSSSSENSSDLLADSAPITELAVTRVVLSQEAESGSLMGGGEPSELTPLVVLISRSDAARLADASRDGSLSAALMP